MNINDAIKQLRVWCANSGGQPIEVSPTSWLSFKSLEIYSEPDFLLIERELGWVLPETYKLFMREIGRSQLFINEYGLGLYFYGPEEILNASLHIWDEEEESGADRFCFIGDNRGTGDYIGYVINRHGPKNFDVFCHEYPLSSMHRQAMN